MPMATPFPTFLRAVLIFVRTKDTPSFTFSVIIHALVAIFLKVSVTGLIWCLKWAMCAATLTMTFRIGAIFFSKAVMAFMAALFFTLMSCFFLLAASSRAVIL